MAKLVITRDGAIEAEAQLTAEPLRIGRDSQNHVVLDDPDKGVSRFHAEVRQQGEGFAVVDLGSRNGIWVDGVRVPSVVLGPRVSVTIGPHVLKLVEDRATAVDEYAPTIMVPRGDVREGTEPTPLALPRSGPMPIGRTARSTVASGERPSSSATLPRNRSGAWIKQPVYFWTVVGCALLAVTAVVATLVYRSGGEKPVAQAEQNPPPSAPPSVPDSKEEIVRVIAAAKERVANKDYDGALSDLQSALDRFPGDAGLQAAKAEAEASRDADTDRNRAVDANPSGPVPGIPQHPDESADAYARRARRVQDKFNSGKKSLQQKDYRAAIDAFGSIEQEHQDAKRFLTQAKQDLSNARRDAMSKGAEAEHNGNWDAALESYKQADALDSGADSKDAVQRMQVKVDTARAQAAAPGRGPAPKTEPIAAGRATPAASGDKRSPTDTADVLISYPRAKLLTVDGTKGKDKDVTLSLGGGQIAVLPKDGGATLASVKYKELAHATYARSKDPKWNPAAPVPPDKLDTPGGGLFGKGARNWLVLQSKTLYLILSLDNSNADEILTQLEARTGLKIDRPAGGL